MTERLRVMVVIGTRPEAVKMAPVIHALGERPEEASVDTVLTGQHGALVDRALEAFGVTPDHNLAIMTEGQSLYDVAHACLDGLRDLVRERAPEVILTQGDTATVFFASLVGYFERVPVGHVEAGLRSGDRYHPFPEEMFRRMTDALSVVHFAPTPGAREHLLHEGIAEDGVFVTGNTVVDALLRVTRSGGLPREGLVAGLIGAIEGRGHEFGLVTAHRRESFGKPIRSAFRAIRRLVDSREGLEIVFPVHPNPQVRGAVEEVLAGHPRIHLLDSVGYLELVLLLSRARIVLTDSGGIQEEAPTFGVPVLVLREVTERPEGIEAGVARLVGTDEERVYDAAMTVLDGEDEPRRDGVIDGGRDLPRPSNPYGDGRAGERIADILIHRAQGTERRTEDWSPR